MEYYFITPEGDGFKTIQLADAYFYMAVQVNTARLHIRVGERSRIGPKNQP